MENSRFDVIPHPQLLEFLFAFKSKVSAVFNDVLGMHEIDHLAVTRINQHNELMVLSSKPSIEYNLFNSGLWQYDQTYDPQWAQLLTQAHWQTLYKQTRYDELYYIKQIKHELPIGLSIAAKLNEELVIYSIASHKTCAHTRELFETQHEDFYKIGQYCSNMLSSLFESCDSLVPSPVG